MSDGVGAAATRSVHEKRKESLLADAESRPHCADTLSGFDGFGAAARCNAAAVWRSGGMTVAARDDSCSLSWGRVAARVRGAFGAGYAEIVVVGRGLCSAASKKQ